MKTREEIRATTTGKIPRPANYKPGEKLKEWDASLSLGAEHLLKMVQPLNDRIVVRLVDEKPKGAIVLTDPQPLIGGMRKARVMKCGPGKWIEGEWWRPSYAPPCSRRQLFDGITAVGGDDWEINTSGYWEWFPGYRRPIAVHPGQTVYIGNWVDLEADGLALCMEGDIRGYVSA